MPDTYTASLKLTLPADGDLNWGSLVNTGITSLVDEAVAGTSNIVLPAGTTDRTLTSGDGSAPNEARKMFLNITGTPNGATNVICPAVSKLYFVNNATTIPVLTTTGASGTGSTATLTFAVQTVAPYTIGQTITVAGVTPAGYNGSYVVTGSTTTTVAYASTTTGAQTVAGTVTAATFGITLKTASGTGVSVLNGTKAVLYCNGTDVVTAVSSTVAGSNTQVQYNSSGALGASSRLVFDGYNLVVDSVSIGRGATSNASNIAIGADTLTSWSGGLSGNVCIGITAGQLLTSGGDNTFIGASAGAKATTALFGTGIGTGALFYLTTGNGNTAIGQSALANVTTSANNTGVGNGAGSYNTSGNSNTSIGASAGVNNYSGSNNICIGNNSQPSTTSVSNQVTLGDSGITVLRCQVTSITALSDVRDKTNIQPLIPGLNFINRLNPVSFDWNMRDGGKVGLADTGFIAQELQANQSLTQEFVPGLVYAENPDRLEAAYGKLIPVLVKAIQELTARVADLEGK